MANIQPYIDQILNAVYGEEVRSSIVNALEKINDDNNSYAADDGSIVAWYGDADYKEDGSMGQVMVYQPKFYYLVCPVEYDPIDTGIGYHLRKANYYVSEKPRAGFRLHPAFYDASGNEIDYFLTSAYEGSIYDASASAYVVPLLPYADDYYIRNIKPNTKKGLNAA